LNRKWLLVSAALFFSVYAILCAITWELLCFGLVVGLALVTAVLGLVFKDEEGQLGLVISTLSEELLELISWGFSY